MYEQSAIYTMTPVSELQAGKLTRLGVRAVIVFCVLFYRLFGDDNTTNCNQFL
jgi:hypothetical protein